MRRFLTWAVVGALAVIGLFAARDALRNDPALRSQPTEEHVRSATQGEPPAIPGRIKLAAELSALGARGALYLTDATCRRFVLSLPGLQWAARDGLPGSDCGFWARPIEGSGFAARQVNAETIEVTSGAWSFAFAGTSPAFKPDGTLTFVRGGRIYEWTARCAESTKTVRFEGNRDLPRCVRRIDGMEDVHEIAWLDDSDYAVVAGPDQTASLLVVRGGRATRLWNSVGARLGGLEASPNGSYVAARIDGSLTLFRTDSADRIIDLPSRGALVRSLSWSPDDRLAAVATDQAVEIFAPGGRRQSVTVPLTAAVVQWR
jgi:hypothetical protein